MEIWLPVIKNELCTACGLCVATCPTQAVKLDRNQLVFSNPEACTYCGLCEEMCPSGAVNLEYEIRFGS